MLCRTACSSQRSGRYLGECRPRRCRMSAARSPYRCSGRTRTPYRSREACSGSYTRRQRRWCHRGCRLHLLDRPRARCRRCNETDYKRNRALSRRRSSDRSRTPCHNQKDYCFPGSWPRHIGWFRTVCPSPRSDRRWASSRPRNSSDCKKNKAPSRCPS